VGCHESDGGTQQVHKGIRLRAKVGTLGDKIRFEEVPAVCHMALRRAAPCRLSERSNN
jgi:hypothetical protein